MRSIQHASTHRAHARQRKRSAKASHDRAIVEAIILSPHQRRALPPNVDCLNPSNPSEHETLEVPGGGARLGGHTELVVVCAIPHEVCLLLH